MLESRSAHRLLLALISFALLVLSGSTALAAGRVEWKSKVFKERDDKSWRLELAIYLPKPPDVAYVPMKFEFEPLVYYERALIDGRDGPVENKVPLEGRQPLIEGVEIGFLETGTAKIQSRTRFSFKVKRDLGYDAGEYKVTVRDTRDGKVVGTPTTIVFDGVNEIIDRRAIVFSGEKKKKKEEKKEEAKSDEGGSDAKPDGAEPETKKDEGGEGETTKSEDDSEGGGDEGPPPIEEKPGGCGCRVPGGAQGTSAGLVAWLVLGIFVVRRRALR